MICSDNKMPFFNSGSFAIIDPRGAYFINICLIYK